MTEPHTRLLIANDHPVVRAGLQGKRRTPPLRVEVWNLRFADARATRPVVTR